MLDIFILYGAYDYYDLEPDWSTGLLTLAASATNMQHYEDHRILLSHTYYAQQL